MNILKSINLKGLGKKYSGKVRDCYIVKDLPAGRQDKRILITTDRISAFDRILGFIPYKGQVLNELSAFWFEHTKDITNNHVIEIPDPNVTIAKNTIPIPIEMVVRGYMSGITVTAIWPSYQKGERIIYGVRFPNGLTKNQKLPTPVITPTYHGDITGKGGHDTRLERTDILKNKIRFGNGQIVDEKLYEKMEHASLQLFKRGTRLCQKAGIVLVDTKYEFGIYNNELILIDEIHTPDSSRFWIQKTYKQRFKKGEEPENFDKEFLRLWYKKHGYTGDGKPPKMPTSLIMQVSRRYRDVYEKITGKKFVIHKQLITTRIKKNLNSYAFS